MRAFSRRHPLMQGKKRGVWHADLVGKVNGYPKTEADYIRRQEIHRASAIAKHAAGKLTRKGIPDGWAGRGPELKTLRRKADAEAQEIVKLMIEKQMLEVAGEEALGNEAILAAVAVIRAQDDKGEFVYNVRDRQAAMSLVAKYTKSPPVQRTAVAVSKAEDWLAVLAAEVATNK